jgi:predicted NUDIX family NTP pyrophosphohydrolase
MRLEAADFDVSAAQAAVFDLGADLVQGRERRLPGVAIVGWIRRQESRVRTAAHGLADEHARPHAQDQRLRGAVQHSLLLL